MFGDALFPVLPGETTLNAACVLAANGQLNLILIMISGAIGAIAGDSTLYWIARSAHGKTKARVDRAVEGKTGRTVIRMLHDHGPAFILFGRYVPGLRFAINVTLGGVVRMPYRKFLLWSALSGVLWAVWVCLSAYFISSALEGYPLAALVLSTCLGTVLIGSCVVGALADCPNTIQPPARAERCEAPRVSLADQGRCFRSASTSRPIFWPGCPARSRACRTAWPPAC